MMLALVALASVGGGAAYETWNLIAKRTCSGVQTEYGFCEGLAPCNSCIPQNCQFSSWGQWYEDATTCSGLCYRSRTVALESNECGTACQGNTEETKPCLKPECKSIQDCIFAAWSAWNMAQCKHDEDQMFRTRSVEVPSHGGGMPCIGPTKETKPCTPDLEQQPCQYSDWEMWTACSKTCGFGRKTRMRRVIQEATHGGPTCEGDTYEVGACNTVACGTYQDCLFGNWEAWQGCDSTSPYQEIRKRRVAVPASGGGEPCNGTTKEVQSCDSDMATSANLCKLSDWTGWSICDKTCQGGQTIRNRYLLTPMSFNVSCIHGPTRETAPCGAGECFVPSAGDCQVGDWDQWTTCSNKCGKGIKTRTRIITGATTGRGCEAHLEEVGTCERFECTKTDCRWADWEMWGACTATCDGGIKRRNRHIAVSPELNGTLCAPNAKAEVAMCGTTPCPKECIDGEWSVWSSWSRCSATCDDGYMSRHRNVHTAANNCGKPAQGLEQEFMECPNLPDCIPRKDCRLASWEQWSDCTCSCFGIKERSRQIIQYKQGKGTSCFNETLKEVVPCNPGVGGVAAPGCDSKRPLRNCVLSEWREWSGCTVSCGRGQMYRTRTIITPPSHGGTPCGTSLQQTKECAMGVCAGSGTVCLDCTWGQWNEWGACLKGDQKWRHRHIEQMPNHCGALCDYKASKEIGNCSHAPDEGALYCAWTPWSAYSRCPGGCGTATRGRHRHLEITTSKPEHGWLIAGTHGLTCTGEQAEVAACPVFMSCQRGCIPRDCSFLTWSTWTEPTTEGLCNRVRQIREFNNECGKPCTGVLLDTKRCYPQTEAVLDCKISGWTMWSTCNHRNQQKYRIRTIRQMPQGGGLDCPNGPMRETSGCATDTNTPMDCTFTSWSEWNSCSATCGWGLHIRTRRISTPALYGGAPCNDNVEEAQACVMNQCGSIEPRDCELSVWEDWGRCDHTGQRTRTKQMVQEVQHEGTPCKGAMEQIGACDLFTRQDCELSAWVEWSSCSKTCAGGQRTRHRQVHQYPQFGGADCPPSMNMTEAQPCNYFTPCGPNHPCQVSVWAMWSPCSVSCGSGQRTRWRNVTATRAGNGAGCLEDVMETDSCHITACTVENCQWGNWIEWGECTKKCGGGQQTRERIVEIYPKFGGTACTGGNKIETRGCNQYKCSTTDCTDAVWGTWAAWEPCSKTCRGGVTWRNRQIAIPASSCGRTVEGKSQEVSSCNTDVPCDVNKNCEFTPWETWSACTATCNGIKKRTRKILSEGAGDGVFCNGGLSEILPCDPAIGESYPAGCPTEGTPVDCSFEDWGKWSSCSAMCGPGQTMRERVLEQTAQNGGKGCNAPLKQTKPCSNGPCTTNTTKKNPCDPSGMILMMLLDCKWQDWGQWSACDKCPGQKTRHRAIAQLPLNGGKPCKMESAEEIVECPRNCFNTYACTWAEWGMWSSCTAKCGEGSRSRQRQLVVAPTPTTERLWEAGLASEESLDEKLQELKDAHSRHTQEMLAAFTAGLAAFAAVFMVATRLLDHKKVLRSQGSQSSSLRTEASVEMYTPVADHDMEGELPLQVPLNTREGVDVELQTVAEI